MKTKLWVTFALLLVSLLAQESEGRSTADYSSKNERGFFSLGLMSGYQESRLLNQDGSFAGYKGYLYGVSIDIQLWGSGYGEFRLFGSSLNAAASGSSQASDKLNRSETLYGMKVYANPSLFLAAGAGTATQKSRVSSTELTVSHQFTALGAGYDLGLGESNWFASFQGWYKSGPIRRNENINLVGNSSYDGAEFHLVFVWSPPLTTINYSGK